MVANVAIDKLTVAEFHQMEFDENDTYLYELLDGELVKKKAPAPRHQRILRDLSFAIHQFVMAGKLGEVLFAPVDVFLNEYNAPQPDLVFVAQNQIDLITNDGTMGVPTLVVEIISPSSIYRDRVTKKALYEQFGIQEYWLIDPADNYIEIFVLTDGEYKLRSAASLEEGQLVSVILPGLTIDLVALFGE